MSRGVVGALVGAGGATAYYNSEAGETLRHLLNTPGLRKSTERWGRGSSAGGSPEVERLAQLVEQLSRDVQRQQSAGITIMHGHEAGNVNGTMVLAGGGALLVAAAYMRFVRGWNLTDLLYVTRSSLKASVSQVTEGLDALGSRLMAVRAFLQQQVEALRAKQDEALAAQAALGEQVGQVGADVEATRGEVAAVGSAVRDMELSLDTVAANQRLATEGIYVLCRVVGEMMKGSSSRMGSLVDLEKYLRRPNGIADMARPQVAGLETLLRDIDSDSPAGLGVGNSQNHSPNGRSSSLLLPPSGSSSAQRMALAAVDQAQTPRRTASAGPRMWGERVLNF